MRLSLSTTEALYLLLSEIHEGNRVDRHTKGSFCRECIAAYEALATAIEKAEMP